jgi:anthranilate synthase component 1
MAKLFTKYLELVNDIDTPVSVFNKIASKYKDGFLFESVLQAKQVGRYSFIGFNALKTITSMKVLEELRSEIANLEDDNKEELPFFYKGFVGFFPFETFCEIEPTIKPKKTEKAFLYLVGNLIVFDHVQQKLFLIQNSLDADFKSNLNEVVELINKNSSLKRLDFDTKSSVNKSFSETGFYSNTGEVEFKKLIEKAKKHIFEGDVFQMVLSHKFLKDFKTKTLDPFLLYRILRTVNPSPYQFLFNYVEDGEFKTLVGSSPEMMVKSIKVFENGKDEIKAQISPIAGTYRRTHDAIKDEALKQKLLTDKKELAEHVMLIDLARNDLSRVCREVSVPEKIFVETYSHVMHIVSNVVGFLKPMSKADSVVDLVKAAFPAGTLSGAPKIEAIKLILDLEKESRGYYGGTIGYFGLNGTLDTAIMIRTMLVTKDQICIQAGCGVVADSDPHGEWQETFNKANALIDVVLMAENIT